VTAISSRRNLRSADLGDLATEPFAVGAQEHVADYWTFHQPAEDRDVCCYSATSTTVLLRSVSAAVTTFVIPGKTLLKQNAVTQLN